MRIKKRQTTIWVTPKDDKIATELDKHVPEQIAGNRSAKCAYAMWALLAGYKATEFEQLQKEQEQDEL